MAGPLTALAPYLIQAGAAIGSQIIGNIANRRAQDRAFKQNVAMWEKSNEYNSPLMQQQRIKEAGLNPALMYGQGTVGNATQLPQYQAPRVSAEFTPAMNPVGMMQQYLELKKQGTDIALTEQQIKVQTVQETLINTQQLKYASDARIAGLQADLLSNTWDSDREARIANNLYDIAKSKVEQWRSDMVQKYNIRPEDAVWLRGIVTALELFGFDKLKLQNLLKGF